jgi:hypothetical protein
MKRNGVPHQLDLMCRNAMFFQKRARRVSPIAKIDRVFRTLAMRAVRGNSPRQSWVRIEQHVTATPNRLDVVLTEAHRWPKR